MSSVHPNTELVLGPPGTGKTTELVQMVEDLLSQGVDPRQIGYYSFTRRAATEAQDRAMARFGLRRSDLPHFRTLHSEAMRQMGLSSQQVLDGSRLQEFADYVGERITGRFSMEEGLRSGAERGDRMLFMDNLARVRQRTLREQYDSEHDDLDWVAVERFGRALREFKQTRGIVDYTDMLQLFVQDRGKVQLTHVIVDEAQDLSALQWSVVSQLCRDATSLVVAGDDDQTIYKWAGADVDFLLHLDGRVRVLGQSYRVPRSVQRVAASIIDRCVARRPKQWEPRDAEGTVTHVSDLSEVDWSGPGVLVLARNQYFLEPVAQELRAAGYLYEHRGHPSVRQSVLDAVVTWERLRNGQAQCITDVRGVYKLLEVGVGVQRGHKGLAKFPDDAEVSFDTLQRDGGLLAKPDIWHQVLTGVPLAERTYMVRCRRRGERFSQAPRIRLGTIHDSKGGERSRVVLLTDMAPRTHREMYEDPDSEARVFYVGATRAIDELVVRRPVSHRFYEV